MDPALWVVLIVVALIVKLWFWGVIGGNRPVRSRRRIPMSGQVRILAVAGGVVIVAFIAMTVMQAQA